MSLTIGISIAKQCRSPCATISTNTSIRRPPVITRSTATEIWLLSRVGPTPRALNLFKLRQEYLEEKRPLTMAVIAVEQIGNYS